MWELTLFLSNSYEACGGRFHKTWGEWLYWRWSKAFWLKNCIQIIFLSQNYSNNLSERTKKYVKVNIFPFWHKQPQSNIHPIVQRHAVIIQSCVRNPIHYTGAGHIIRISSKSWFISLIPFKKWNLYNVYIHSTQTDIFQVFISINFDDYNWQLMKTPNSVSQKIWILWKDSIMKTPGATL